MRLWLLFLLMVPLVSHADVATFAIVGDTQRAVYCRNGGEGWNYAVDAFNWVAARSDVDMLIQTGDIVETFALRGDGDCFCWGTANPGSCSDIDHPLYGTGTCNFCGAAAAIDCTGAESENRLYCEWARARVLADKIETAGIPWMFVDGNHDYDTSPTPPTNPQKAWTAHAAYFGANKLTHNAVSVETTVVDNGGVNLPPVISMVISAANANWLVIGVPIAPWWRPTAPGAAEDKAAILAAVEAAIARHPKMPTILVTHEMVTFDGTGPSSLSCGFCEDEPDEGAGLWWTGHDLWNEIAEHYPQVFLMIGGHDRGIRHITQYTDAGHKVLGVLVDYSFGLADAYVPDASWISDDNNPSATTDGNGGGGMVSMLNIDPVRGQIWNWSYSDREGERDMRDSDGEYSGHWQVTMPLCLDDVRFDFPAEACPELEKSPECCRK